MSASPILEHSQKTPAILYNEKYAWLMRWALHFCNKDRSAAEDLVQDVFMQMLVSWQSFQEAVEPEKLLYTYLKYSFLLKCRKDRRYSFQALSAIDFESLHLSLRRETFANALDLQEGLRRIVHYLNWRKQQAKAASILLLRFFHGFFPSEIMQVAILTRRSVDTGLAQAREEAKSYLADPAKVQAMYRGAPPLSLPSRSVLSAEEFVIALRAAVFADRYGECLPEAVLRERYLGPAPKSIECDLLAHIVSCRKCLNLVSRWCKLPSLDDRLPEEAWGFAPKERAVADATPVLSSTRKGLGTGVAGKLSGKRNEQALFSMRGGQQRFRVAHEHRPKALLIAVDGQVLAARDISSISSELKIEMSATAPKELIEIMSEQELPLLTVPLLLPAGEGPPFTEHESNLANGQRIRLLVRYTPRGVQLELEYFDPFFAPDQPANLTLCDSQAVPTLITHARVAGTRLGRAASDDSVEPLRQEAEGGLLPLLRRPLLGLAAGWRYVAQSFHPYAVLATCAAVLLVIVFARWERHASLPSAQYVLNRATKQGTSPRNATGVIVQGVRVRATTGKAKTSFERQLTRDASGRKHLRLTALSVEQKTVANMLLTADVGWDDPLSAANYRDWHNHANIERDTVEPGANGAVVLTSFVKDGSLTSQSLTLRGSDFHPIARTIDFRDQEKIEIAEVDYRVIPWDQANPRWFEAEPAPIDVRKPRPVVLPMKKLIAPPTAAELDEAELGVRLGLSEANAEGGERLQISRAVDGVHVDGLVADEQRQKELVGRLAQVPHAVVNIRTFREFEQEQAATVHTAQSPSGGITVGAQSAEPSPLERLLQQQGKPAEEAGQFAHSIFANSITIQQSAAAVDDLDRRFPAASLSAEGSHTLARLRSAQLVRLKSAIVAQERVLQQAGDAAALPSQTPMLSPLSEASSEDGFGRSSLSGFAARHAQLCNELVSQSTPSVRAPQIIFSDIDRSLISLETIADQNVTQQSRGTFPRSPGATRQER